MPHGTDLPPPRPGDRYVPVPIVGVVISDDDLRERVHRVFHVPMLVLALLILPLLALELWARPAGWWGRVLDIGFALIWVAFLVEFIVKITLAESRVEYVRRNWLDVIIILVPVLRPLRAKAAVVRSAKVFTVRGVGTKGVRYAAGFLLGLEATTRLRRRFGMTEGHDRPPEKMTREALMDEVRRLRRVRRSWESWYEDRRTWAEARGLPVLPPPEPPPERECATGEPDPRHDDGGSLHSTPRAPDACPDRPDDR